MESRPDHFRVTLITSDRFPYNYKSVSYPFFIRFKEAAKAREVAKSIDEHLEKGYEMRIFLKGSEIVSYKLLGNDSQ